MDPILLPQEIEMRNRLFMLGLLGVAASFVAGCLLMPAESKIPRTVVEALDSPDSFVLYSLQPVLVANEGEKGKGETFHGHIVLGKTEIKDAVTRRRLVAAFNRGVNDHDGSVAGCFIPHHGIRAQKGKHTVELVICFKCAQVQTFVDGEPAESMLISTSPRALFNEVLERARVPLSEEAK